MWWNEGSDKRFEVSESLPVFGFVGKHQCIKSDTAATGSQWREQWGGVEELWKVENNSVSEVEYLLEAELPGTFLIVQC